MSAEAPAPRSAARRIAQRRRRRRRALVLLIVLVLVIAGCVWGFTALLQRGATPSAAATPSSGGKEDDAEVSPPLTPEEQLLADADDPNACAVSFVGDGAPADPQLQWQTTLYQALPIPAVEGAVFAGWYTSAEAAAAYDIAARVNGSDPVVCADQRIELHAAWMSPEQNAAEDAQIPILMYHQFTTRPEGEDGWLRGNYAYIGDFDAQMEYIATTGFYLPTWDELSAFIDGRLYLPSRSVIITDDDADQTWFDLAAPIVEQYQVLTTSFMVTAFRTDPPPSMYVLRRSHTHDMHHAGANGDGMMVNASAEEIAADLNTSGDLLGVREVIAYPYGHYNDTAIQGVQMAGYEMARTIEPGYVSIGTDKYTLPVVRIDYGMGLDALIARIG